MNAFERTAQFGRELFEINAESMRKITELSAENFKKYVELNQDYMQKLPEVRELSTFVELQREYNEKLWKGMQDDLKARGDIVREAVEETGGVLRGVFSSATDQVEKAADQVSEAAAAA
ncbi:MAG: phasin family protein [Pseudomonadales bacterium]